jgi:hypothetical protein
LIVIPTRQAGRRRGPQEVHVGRQPPSLARLPALTSRRYTGEFNEVKALGAKTGSLRTPQQTEMFRPLVGHPPDQAPPLGEPYEQELRS